MTMLTLQLDENLVEKARFIADKTQSSVDAVVAEALEQMEHRQHGFLRAVDEAGLFDTGGPYTHDELNQRQGKPTARRSRPSGARSPCR